MTKTAARHALGDNLGLPESNGAHRPVAASARRRLLSHAGHRGRPGPALSRRHEEGHFGLGLAIARRYALLLKADLEVESEPGCGACLTIAWF